MKVSEIISGGKIVKASGYSEGTQVLIDENLYKVINWSETCSKNNHEFLKIEEKATIPKRIAKQADNTSFAEMFRFREQAFLWWFDRKDEEYIPIIFAYLAGKALGVDLVKVGEG